MSDVKHTPLDEATAASATDDNSDAIAEQIYDELIRTICIDVASGAHKLVKSGDILSADGNMNGALSSISSSSSSYHDHSHSLYTTSSNKRRRIKGSSASTSAPENRTRILSEDGSTSGLTTSGVKKEQDSMRLRTRGSSSGVDAWGRVPPKDVLTTCKLCSKTLSATRFAAHLDKCLGIGNTRSGHSSRSASSTK